MDYLDELESESIYVIREAYYRFRRLALLWSVGKDSTTLLWLCRHRFSWQTALGGAPEGLVEDNRKLWSGDHIVDPSCVPGILLANRPLRRAGVRQADAAPTVIAQFGLPTPSEMNGCSFLGR